MIVEYDPDKSERCLQKRGFDFGFAVRIFLGPTVEWEYPREYGEVRMVAVGMVDGRALTVVYTDRDTARRIISARLSTRKERTLYAQGS